MNYYNEFDPKAAAWLRELIRANLIPTGEVDTRSITEVRATDLVGFTQCHFFAGIGGWSEALRLAGWPPTRPVWTGSAPCQPFSCAGKGKGHADERHLWPEMFRLIRECLPAIVIGEQVESAVRHGWLDGVFADLESQDYACGAVVLGAHSAGAPHIRQRLYWLANARHEQARGPARSSEAQSGRSFSDAPGCGDVGRLVNPIKPRLEGHIGNGHDGNEPGRERAAAPRPASAAGTVGAWEDYEVLDGIDGKRRRAQPGAFPLAHGVPNRVVKLRGYGNAIVPEVASEFIKSACEVI